MTTGESFDSRRPSIAYFSMEVGLLSEMPTYSGGLGVLAGDMLRSSADLALPMICGILLHRKGYFRQSIDAEGNQSNGSRHQDREGRIAVLATQPPVTEHGCRREQTISEGRMTMAELPR